MFRINDNGRGGGFSGGGGGGVDTRKGFIAGISQKVGLSNIKYPLLT